MISLIDKLLHKRVLKSKNCEKGKIIVGQNMILDLADTAKFKVSGKLIIGDSEWKKDNRTSGMRLGKNAIIQVKGKERIYTGCYVSVGENAILEFGGDGYVNHGCNIDCCQHISIGKGTIIAKQVLLRDSDNHEMLYDGYIQTAPIVIGDHCWIGMRAIILKGVTIGEGSVIAAGAVVTNDIPPHSLAAGVPAKVIKTDITWK